MMKTTAWKLSNGKTAMLIVTGTGDSAIVAIREAEDLDLREAEERLAWAREAGEDHRGLAAVLSVYESGLRGTRWLVVVEGDEEELGSQLDWDSATAAYAKWPEP